MTNQLALHFSRLFPEDEAIEMMPVLKKSKEMAKQLREKGITPNFRRPTNPSFSTRSNGFPPRGGGRGGGGGNNGNSNHNYMDRGGASALRGRRKFLLRGKSRLMMNGPIGKKPPMYNRMIPMHRFGGSTTAAAEAYVADYMRTMQHQLPPMPYVPPASFSSSLPPQLPRYYDGIPVPPPPIPNRNQSSSSSSTNYDKRSYDEFMWKNKNRNSGGPNTNNRDRSKDSRDSYRSGGDKHRNYRR